MHKLVFILAGLWVSLGSGFPQEDSIKPANELHYDSLSSLQPVKYDEARIQEYKNSEEFSYIDEIEEDSWWTRLKRWITHKYNSLLNWLFGDYEANSVLAFIFNFLPYLLLGLLLGLISYLFVRLNPAVASPEITNRSDVFLSKEEEIIQSENIQDLIDEAIANKQYRLAVRYYYLKNLQQLDRTGAISYQFQKTNEDYTSEIKSEALKRQFMRITRFYDFIWYGNFKVSEHDFRLAEKDFNKMNNYLKPDRNE